MLTTTRRFNPAHFARTMLLGLVLALGIAVVGDAPEASWLGFVMAAMYAEARPGGSCLARIPRRSRG